MSVSLEKNVSAPQSGYTICTCRDCETSCFTAATGGSTLCWACLNAGCVSIAPYNEGVQFCTTYECQRDDAYGER